MKEQLLYAGLPVYARRVDEARRIIKDGLERCRKPYVACSFGKDSAALLHLVLEQSPSVAVRFMSWAGESDALHDYEKIIKQWQARYSFNLDVIEMSRATLNEKTDARWQSLEFDSDAYFIGLRADENKTRLMTLRCHGVIYQRKDSLLRISPLAWWTTKDVAAYIVQHDLPTLDAYLAEGWETRTTARVPRASVRHQVLAALKRRSLSDFNALRKSFPEIADYV